MNSPETSLRDQYCIFHIGGADFAVAAAAVREVSDFVPLVGVPHSAAVLQGLCHHRNEFLPVLSLPALLGEPTCHVDGPFLLVMESGDGPWGLPISRAIALESLEMASTGEPGGDAQRSIVMGTASFRDGVVRILSADRLYQAATDILGEAWTSHKTQSISQETPAVINSRRCAEATR